MVFAVGLAAGLMLAVGYVLQQHEAARSTKAPMHAGLLLELMRRPIWLGGIAAMVAGQILSAVGLGAGSLVVVEPLLATNVLFGLPLGAWWARQRPGRSEWAGALLLVGGLTLFLAGGSPSAAVDRTPVQTSLWLLAGGSVAVVVLALVVLSRRRSLPARATLLALGAGLVFGLQDVLTQRSLLLLDDGVLTMLRSWQPWVLIAAAVLGLIMTQSAFELAPLSASLPALNVAEPVCGISLGVALLGEHFRGDGPALVAEVLGIAAMLAGVCWITRSPLLHCQRERSDAVVVPQPAPALG